MKKLFIILFVIFPSLCVSKLQDFKVATWNLQGSSASNESKWNINVRQLLTGSDASDVLMIQEAGSLPASATPTGRVIQPVGVGIPIEEFRWNIGTASRPNLFFIYYSRLDVGANRVNLAIVSRHVATDVHVITSGVPILQARPAIGIQIGDDAFFSVHALSTGGGDAPRLVQSVHQYFNVPNRQHISWMLVGDFNRSPVSLQNALRGEAQVEHTTLILSPTEPTHRSGNILDYAVAHNATIPEGQPQRLAMNASIMFNRFRSQITSDHFPVSFTPNR